jgi:hypothetical protein
LEKQAFEAGLLLPVAVSEKIKRERAQALRELERLKEQ